MGAGSLARFCRLAGGSQVPPRERNLAWRRFLGGPSRVSHTPAQDEVTAAQTVADLRATAAAVGPIELDCDVPHLPDTDQRLVVYSAAPGTPASEALALLRVVGSEEFHDGHERA